jgi:fructose-bisphosphate aldolase class II
VTLATARDLVERACSAGSAVPAFNVIILEHAEAIVAGAEASGVPVLLQVSENAIGYHDGRFEPLVAACRELAAAAGVGVGIHLDHIQDSELMGRIIRASERFGIGSVMFDGSDREFDDNVDETAATTVSAHAAGLWIEAELGEVGGKDGAHAPGVRTDPAEARRFAQVTAVDALAVAVGSSHAMIDRSAKLDLTLIRALAEAVHVPLVLHGSSGVPDAGIAAAVAAGIRKVNVGTALNVALTGALREGLADRPDAVDPRVYLAGARASTRDTVAHLCEVIAG